MALTIAPPPIPDTGPRQPPPAMQMTQGLSRRSPVELLAEAGRLLAQAGDLDPTLAQQLGTIVQQIMEVARGLAEQLSSRAPTPLTNLMPGAAPPDMSGPTPTMTMPPG